MNERKLKLNRAQNAMYFMHCLSGISGLYNNAECIEFSGKINTDLMRKAIRMGICECEVLSHLYLSDDVFQPYLSPTSKDALFTSCNIPEVVDAKSFFIGWAVDKIVLPFDLSSELPIRFYLCQSPSKDYLVSVAHHICLDGYGFMMFFERVAQIYTSLEEGSFVVPPNRYRKLEVLVNKEEEKKEEYQQAGEFWQQQLQDRPAPVSFKPLGSAVNRKNIRHSMGIDGQLWKDFEFWSEKQKVSLADVVFALFFLALYRSRGQEKLSLGMISMERFGNPSINIPCLQINTVPLLVDISEHASFLALCKAIAQTKRQFKKHSHYRCEDLKRDMAKKSSAHIYGPLINILPFNQAENFGSLTALTHNLASGALEDLMVQMYIKSGVAPRIDLDANPNSYKVKELRHIGAELIELMKDVAKNKLNTAGGQLLD